MAAVTICSDFEAPKNKVSHCFHRFPIYLPWSDGTGCHDLRFLNVELSVNFSLSSFIFIKRHFSFSSLSAIRVMLSAYLRLLIFLPAILIPACASSSPAFLMMYSAYTLNKQGDSIQPWRTPFLIWNQSIVPCLSISENILTTFESPWLRGNKILSSRTIPTASSLKSYRKNAQCYHARRTISVILNNRLPPSTFPAAWS